MPQAPKNLREFEALLEIVKKLRGPDGCPWDKEQTHQSLTRFAIEEAFELAEAIDQHDQSEIISELGDLLLQVVLHSEIASQDSRFEIADVIQAINEKMVRRHPHVFGDVSVKDSNEVLKNWSEIKASEKSQTQSSKPSFDLPKALPALIQAHKIGEKTSRRRFDWSSASEVMKKVDEELDEIKQAIRANNKEDIASEIGDLLFSVSQLARHLDIDAEQALRQCNQRFERRFFKMQDLAESRKLDFMKLSDTEVEDLWTEAKKLT